MTCSGVSVVSVLNSRQVDFQCPLSLSELTPYNPYQLPIQKPCLKQLPAIPHRLFFAVKLQRRHGPLQMGDALGRVFLPILPGAASLAFLVGGGSSYRRVSILTCPITSNPRCCIDFFTIKQRRIYQLSTSTRTFIP